MKYFVISDIHGYYRPLVDALEKVGYDSHNDNHTLIALGDLLDRGRHPKEVLDFFSSINPERLLLVNGNHEDIFRDLMRHKHPDEYDFCNGTVRTFFVLAGRENDYRGIDWHYWDDEDRWRFQKAFEEVVRTIRDTGVADLILFKEKWRDYVEIGNRILVHGFYPLSETVPVYKGEKPQPCYDPRWREASRERWKDARWTWGHEAIQKGFFEPERKRGKTIVMGHVTSAAFHEALSGNVVAEPLIYDCDGVVAIDAATHFTKQINVYTFEEE